MPDEGTTASGNEIISLILVFIGFCLVMAGIQIGKNEYKGLTSEAVMDCVQSGGVYQAPYSLMVASACKYPQRVEHLD